MQYFRFVQNILGRFRNSGAVGADHGRHSRNGQFLRGERRRAGIPAVVLNYQFELLAVDAARLVHFIGEQAHNLLHVQPFTGPTAGERTHKADFDGVGMGRKRQNKPQSAKNKGAQKFHKTESCERVRKLGGRVYREFDKNKSPARHTRRKGPPLFPKRPNDCVSV